MDTVLQILISAVDEASETLAGISDSLSAMAEETAEASDAASASFESMATSMETSLNEVGLTMNTVTGEIEDALLTQEQSFALAAQVVEESDQEIIDQMLATGSTAQEAAADITEANAEIDASSEETSTSSAGAYAGLAAIAGIAFLGITNAISDAVGSAQAWDEESANIAQTLKNTGSAIPVAQVQAYAQQVQSVTLLTQQQALQAEGLILNYKDLQGSYQSITMLTADLATKMSQTSGTMSDNMPNAAKILTNALEDPVAGINQLIRQGTVAFPAATVTMIENLAKAGDTAGADAVIIDTLNHSIGGMAQAAAQAPGAGLTQMSNQITALGTVIGNDLLPLLDALVKDLMPVIQYITAWAEEHPKLTDAILIGAIAFTGLLLVIGLIGVAVITVTPAIAFLTAAIGAMATIAALPIIPFVALGAAIAILAALIISNWGALEADMEAIGQIISANWDATWNGIYTFGVNIVNQIKNMIHTTITDISNDWTTVWTGIATFFSNIWSTIINGLKSDINNVISLINSLISGIDGLHINIPSITIPGTKIGTPAVNIGFDIPLIPALATGGIVSVPTVALIGEGGPEAVVPLSSSGIASFAGGASGASSQAINIYIQGGTYLDQGGATMIGNALAKQIIQQIRVKNYAL
jgi:hypothetical protein